MKRLIFTPLLLIYIPFVKAEDSLNKHYDFSMLGSFGTACLGHSKGYLTKKQKDDLLANALFIHNELYKGNKKERFEAQTKVANIIWDKFQKCKND
tara:strand:- start:121 stop:408 length:288 start_codon:yes stop_codon:yes gene_type:complete